MLTVDSSIQYLKGVGPNRAAMFAKAGIRTVSDLLRYKPFRYEDRSNFRSIADLALDTETVIRAEVLVTGYYTTPMKRMRIFEMLVGDGSGSIQVKFFNQPYLANVFHKGQQVILYGVPRRDPYSYALNLLNPEFEIVEESQDESIHTGRIVPIYRRVGQMTTRAIRRMVHSAIGGLTEVPDPIPPEILGRLGLPGRFESLRQLHFPEPPGDQSNWAGQLNHGVTPFQRRLAFEELFMFQLGLQLLRRSRQLIRKERNIAVDDRIREAIRQVLPFRPTQAQKRATREIVRDVCSPKIMNRLLQGDVGSGKTIVALQAMIVVIENGGQVAFMAPTEILAEQHFRTISRYLERSAYRVALLTGSVKGRERKELLESVVSGEMHLLVGTHALIQGQVRFKDLALVVIDEQHRFGVAQRSVLVDKGSDPDTLIMTATPIPRSLALTLYGDLDVSVIDEMPPGRLPVRTIVRHNSEREEVYRLLRDELGKGRQAFVVYPLIEQSEKLDLRAATEMAEHLQADVLPEFSVGLMHGRLKAREKEELMRRFLDGDVQVLVSTTVVEVGIDVPNASIMVVEHAERFGLSQLHQLRGRIGRGRHPGICVLLSEDVHSPDALERLDTMRRTSDGFRIAEKDLELRGPGEFLGTRQSGLPSLVFANLVRDRDLLEQARAEAENYIAKQVGSRQDSRRAIAALAEQLREQYGFFYTG